MSVYYVNLDIDTNPGYLVNDPNNPMGWAEFQPFYAYLSTAPIHEMRIRGSRDAAVQDKLTGGLFLRAWDLSAYGPWRLRINNIGNTPGTLSSEGWRIQDAIIEAHNFTHMGGPPTSCVISNCFIRSNIFTFSSPLNAQITVEIRGSTIKTNSSVTGTNNSLVRVLDSVIDWPSSKVISNLSTFKNSVFTRPNDWSNISSIIDCQFNWSPPTWPAWNATKSAWSTTITTGINEPPQPGNYPYTSAVEFNIHPEYDKGLFGNPRQGIGAFYFSVNKLFLTQRTNRHIVKSLILPQSGDAYYGNHFGTYGVSGNSTSLLNSPWNIVSNSGYFFICDHNNERIVKLDGDLNFISQYSTSSTIGKPCAILADGDKLYVVGVNYHIIENDVLYMYINIEKLDVDLNSLKFTWDTLSINQRLEQRKGEIGFKPISIIKGFETDELVIVGIRKKIYRTVEQSSGFSILQEIPFYKELPKRLLGIIKHSNGFLYLNSGTKIHKFNSTFTNIADSDFIGKSIYGLKERLNGNLITYKTDNQSIVEYDSNLNFVNEIFIDSGETIQSDLYDVMDFVEASY